MGAVLVKADDPRDALGRATRIQLRHFAERNNVQEIKVGMPANLMRGILREKGLTKIDATMPPFGAPPENVPIVDAEADLARQYAQFTKPREDRFESMGVIALRKECKALGIKQGRGEAPHSLRMKLRDHFS